MIDRRKPRLVALPKPWLDTDEAARLNAAFYSAEPHTYFETRLTLLMVAAANPDAINDAGKAGLTYGALSTAPDPSAVDAAEEDGKAADAKAIAFVAADALNLLQHVGETVLRYYLAHCPRPNGRLSPVPWLDIADEVDFAAFKRAVELRFGGAPGDLSDRRRDEIREVFYAGGIDDPVERQRLDRSVEEIEQWLRHFAGYFLEDARLYNAMKHGLAIRPGTAMVRVETPHDKARIAPDAEPLIYQDGPSVEYLARTGRDEPFKRTTRWIRPDIAMAEARIGTQLIQQIWTVGKTRYVDAPAGSGPVRLRFFDTFTVKLAHEAHLEESGELAKLVIRRLDWPVGYLWAYPPELRCSVCDRVPDENEERPRRRWRGIANGNEILRVICPECISRWSPTA